MATAPVGRAAVVTGKSSLSQFRLTQFVDPNALGHPNATTDAQRSPAPCLSELQQMAQAPRPSSGQNQDRTSSVAPSRSAPLEHNPTNSPAGLGALELVELTSNPIIEGILGPNKDGRVRNPVPSKLKGKTDNKLGKFQVMSMGMSPGKKNEGQGKDAAAERDAAARRTSENTASRAKAAQSEKYVPPKKRGLEATLDGPSANRGSPFSRDDHKQRGRPLAPDETKVEQARLLTLLRSINPVTVVDQICKAVAYFGGIPGAPPPEDGIFPESANTRETGALFIGWLAEIFPDVTARSPEIPRDAGPGAGKKKGKQTKGNKGGAELDTSNEPPNSRNGYGFGPAVSAPAWGLPQSLGLVNTPQVTPIPLPEPKALPNAVQNKQADQQTPSTPIKHQLEETTDGNTSTSKRRRGRPKGSRNKGRGEGGQGAPEGPGSNAQHEGQMQGQEGSESPQLQATIPKPPQSNTAAPPSAPPSFTPVSNNQPTVPKPNQGLQYPEQSWPSNFTQNQAANTSNLPQVDELSPEERAVVEAFRHHATEAVNVVPSPITTSKPPPEAGQKRKRAPPKPKPNVTSVPAYQSESTQPVQNMGVLGKVPASAESPMTIAKEGLQWAAVDTAAQAPPPAKRPRQRKPKAPITNDPPSRNQTASVVSSATPPIPPSTIPDSQGTSSQQSVPVTRPPAEGLEAHYERFANLQQQNGRSTPTVPQQQVRQQPKPPSIPPQQPTPQVQQHQQQQQHQHQMQHQKSQQSHQQNAQQSIQQNVQQNVQHIVQSTQQSVHREEPKMIPATSRPSSTTFYNQRTQGSTNYTQQYPSHQPSQLYGTHQASPQMSNNSYRSSSTHTLAQASPQFSQAENTYRTASPHTIAQPSPSFSQTDTTFRNTSKHNIAQPSPSYSQAENPYRTPSTHSMTQPTSRSHTQSQPSHQNHYSQFSDSSYIDLPTLESLGHAGNSSNQNVGLNTGGYGQGMGVGLGTSRSSASSNTLYGSSSGLNSAFDTGADLLRGVSRSGPHANSAYGTTSSGLSNAFDTGTSENEMRERLLRGLRR
ncbi:hypothetical protein EG329_001987 [Mollisiaceae sp. DMI_Dod_QoI]|nr:hypothetical protein EG329_001987 [Helotiales sp. DMI_Dod_QoI]